MKPLLKVLPDSLKKVAKDQRQEFYNSDLSEQTKTAIENLLTDQRMIEVYNALKKHKKNINTNVNYSFGTDLYEYYFWTILFTISNVEPYTPIPESEYKSRLNEMIKNSKDLIKNIERFKWHKFTNLNKAPDTLVPILNDFLIAIDDASRTKPQYHHKPVSSKTTTHEHIKLSLRLSTLMFELFGKPLDNIVALTTSISLDLPENSYTAEAARNHRKKRSILT